MEILSFKLVWIIAAVVFAILEAFSLALIMIWFCVGAVAALIVSLFVDSIIIQLSVFGAVSLILLYIATKKLIRWDRKDDRKWNTIKTNVDAFEGKTGIVTKKIEKNQNGEVKVGNEIWTACTADGETIEENAEIIVLRVEGVKLVVEKEKGR